MTVSRFDLILDMFPYLGSSEHLIILLSIVTIHKQTGSPYSPPVLPQVGAPD